MEKYLPLSQNLSVPAGGNCLQMQVMCLVPTMAEDWPLAFFQPVPVPGWQC
jgi:hypothetical protein